MSKISLPETFPNLPSSIQKIQKVFASNEMNITMLVNSLQEEPLLCANILKLVNSPYYGLQTKVSSINNAVTLLGVTVIRGIIMATILKKSFPLDLSPYGISIETFDKICILRATLLKEWLKNENFNIHMLSSAAFLMESGKIVTSDEITKNNFVSSFIDLLKNHSIMEAEKILFDIDSYELGSMLFRQWLFDDDFTKLISNIPNPITNEDKILHIIYVAINIDGILEDENIDKSIELLNNYGFNTDKFIQALKRVKENF